MTKKILLVLFILILGFTSGIVVSGQFLGSSDRIVSKNSMENVGAQSPVNIIPIASENTLPPNSVDDTRRNAIVRAAEKVSPAVVSLSVTQERVLQQRSMLDRFYSDFWGWYIPPRKYIQKVQSLGSGVIINTDGYILTNAHVVEDAKTIRVTLPRGDVYDGEVVGADKTYDLAVVKIEGDKLPYAELGDSDKLIIGEWAIAIGNPFGFLLEDTEPTVTAGVISAIHRDIKRDPNQVQIFKDMIQTDAAINPGNSGGPLVNSLGQVIGINTFIFTSSKGSEGIGFAIPINRAKAILSDLIEHGEVVKGWIGVYVQNITPLLAQSLDLPTTKGVIIAGIDDSSPAQQAGLHRGDIIAQVDGEDIRDDNDWDEVESLARPNKPIKLTIIRKGKQLNFTVKPVESVSALSTAKRDKFGLYIADITSAIARQLKIQSPSGVVVAKIDSHSEASSWGIEPGDIILQIGRLNISNSKDYFDIVDNVQKGDRLTFIIERNGGIFYMTVKY